MRTPFIVLLVLAAPRVLAGAPATATATTTARAGGQTPRAFRERVEAAAGTDDGLVAITSRGVQVVDPAGGLRRTLWPVRERVRDRQRLATLPAGPVWPGLTADSDFTGAAYDADDIDDGDDPRLADDASGRAWAIDEGPGHGRSAPPAAGAPPLPPLVAAAGDAGWVLRQDGVWKIGLGDATAVRVYAGEGRRVSALAAGGGRETATTVALVAGDQLLRANGGGGAFERLGGPVPRARGLAIDGAGTVVMLDVNGGLRAYAGPSGEGTMLFGDGVDDIATCSRQVLVLRHDDVFALGETGPRRLGPAPPGTERLACGADGAGWATFGTAIHLSADGGRTWTPRPSSKIPPVLGVVPTRAALWLVVRAGLWPLPPAGQPVRLMAPAGAQGAPFSVPGTELAPPGCPRPSAFWRRWSALLPELDLDVEIGRVGAVREIRGLLAASFRVDGLWSGLGPSRGRAGRVWDLRPGVGSTTELDALAMDASDPLAAAERRALARILEEPPTP